MDYALSETEIIRRTHDHISDMPDFMALDEWKKARRQD
jgi:hypothetical protein